MDRFKPGKGIPHCQLQARVVDLSRQETLLYSVNLEGAKQPYNVFNIILDGMHIPKVSFSPCSTRCIASYSQLQTHVQLATAIIK